MNENEQVTQDARESLVMHTVVSTAIHGILLVGLFVVLVVQVPRLPAVFKSYGAELPTLTTRVLEVGTALSTWYQNNPRATLSVIAGLLAVYAAVYYLTRRLSRRMWRILWSGLWYILILLCIASVELPLLHLVTQIGQKPGG